MRGGGTGSVLEVLRNNINIPTIPALARAFILNHQGVKVVQLIVTDDLRIAEDYSKTVMLGAVAIAVSR